MINIPYGTSNFKQFHTYDYYYVDRTNYIEQLERFNQRHLFFVRSRRFGKSLFISMLEHYYDKKYKKEFNDLFGKYYIGKHPTKQANQYLVILFDFSAIDTSSYENTYRSFLNNVKESAKRFLNKYPEYFETELEHQIDTYEFPSAIIGFLSRITEQKAPNQHIYLLIDEYDHFANEILAFRFKEFGQIISQNGYVRKFFEAIKTATRDGVIERFFITGVSPITLDSLTSGFNMATNISLNKDFHTMIGFRESEVLDILKGIEVSETEIPSVLKDRLLEEFSGSIGKTPKTLIKCG